MPAKAQLVEVYGTDRLPECEGCTGWTGSAGRCKVFKDLRVVLDSNGLRPGGFCRGCARPSDQRSLQLQEEKVQALRSEAESFRQRHIQVLKDYHRARGELLAMGGGR